MEGNRPRCLGRAVPLSRPLLVRPRAGEEGHRLCFVNCHCDRVLSYPDTRGRIPTYNLQPTCDTLTLAFPSSPASTTSVALVKATIQSSHSRDLPQTLLFTRRRTRPAAGERPTCRRRNLCSRQPPADDLLQLQLSRSLPPLLCTGDDDDLVVQHREHATLATTVAATCLHTAVFCCDAAFAAARCVLYSWYEYSCTARCATRCWCVDFHTLEQRSHV